MVWCFIFPANPSGLNSKLKFKIQRGIECIRARSMAVGKNLRRPLSYLKLEATKWRWPKNKNVKTPTAP